MSLLRLTLKSLLHRPLSSLLSTVLFGFGVSIVVLILLTATHLRQTIERTTSGIDLVVGAKGSPMQIILCNVFHIDNPTGNISLKEAARITRSRYIQTAIPLSLGDSYAGYRIVGTTSTFLTHQNAVLAEGSWDEEELQAVIGAEVAKDLDLKIGQTFESTHGLMEGGAGHDGHHFTVSGILAPTGGVIDRLIITSIESVWHVHGHEEAHETDSLVNIPHLGLTVTLAQFEEEEITAVLVKYASTMGLFLAGQINQEPNMQAAVPAAEAARLFGLVDTGVDAVNLLGLVIIVLSALSVFIALLNSLKERKYELAILRAMGARRFKVFFLVLFEGIMLTLAGSLLGLLLAHIGFFILVANMAGLQTDGLFFVNQEWLVLAASLMIGIFASVVPAIMAYRTPISDTLAKG
jgi:putative ABC transport system permease protein